MIFALLDVLVIVLLGYVVFNNSRPVPTGVRPVDENPETCSLHLLEALPPDLIYQPAVAYNQSTNELFVTLRMLTDSTSRSDAEGAQSLWTVLPVVAPHLNRLCPLAETLVLTVEETKPHGSAYYIARLPISAVSEWVAGELSDDQLAAKSEYRQIQQQTPAPASPSQG